MRNRLARGSLHLPNLGKLLTDSLQTPPTDRLTLWQRHFLSQRPALTNGDEQGVRLDSDTGQMVRSGTPCLFEVSGIVEPLDRHRRRPRSIATPLPKLSLRLRT